MALTASAVNTSIYKPAYNENVWVTSGSNTSQPNYRFLVEVYDSTNSTKLVPTIKFAPYPGTSTGYIDLHRVLESLVTSDPPHTSTTTAFDINSNSIIRFSLRFGEEYGTTPTQYLNITSTTSSCLVNMSATWLEWSQGTTHIDTYTLSSSSAKFLTAWPQTSTSNAQPINENENAWLYMISPATNNNIYYAVITTYYSDNSQIAQYIVTNDYPSASSQVSHRHLRVVSGTKNLNTISAGKFFSGAQPIITDDVSHYDIWVTNNGGTVKSTTRRYKIIRDCTNYTSYRLHFLNRFGGFDSFTFFRRSDLNTNIERKSFKKITGTFSSTPTWSYNRYDKTVIQHEIKYTDRVSVFSDWVNDSQAQMLKDLWTSPEIYYDDGTYFYHVNILENSFEQKQTVNEKLLNYRVSFEYGAVNYRQRS